MKKLKIALLSSFFWPVKPAYYPDKIAEILKKAGQEVTVITGDSYKDGKKIDRPRIDELNGIKIIRCRNFLSLTEFFKVWFPKIEEGYDIIHCCGGYRHIYSFVGFWKRGNAKYVISPFYPMHPRNSIFQKMAIGIIDRTAGRYLLKNSDYCFAETENEKKWLEEFGVSRIELIPNPIEEELFEKTKGDLKKIYGIKGKMILCIANHTPIKNFEDLIRAMKDVDAKLVIAGEETDYTSKCKELAKELGVEEKIVWAGFMERETKKKAYASCDLFVLPSRRESLGTVILEAMAQKKPVISTNRGGVPNIVPDKFCLYEPGDVNSLVKKMKRVLGDKTLGKELGERGYKKAQGYSESNVSKRYLKILEKLSEKR